MDQRNVTLAKNLVNYSCRLKKGEKVWINAEDEGCIELVRCIIKEVYDIGAIPFVHLKRTDISRDLLMRATEEQITMLADTDAADMERMDAYIGIDAPLNRFSRADIPADKQSMMDKIYYARVFDEICIPKKKWVGLSSPTNAMAQAASMSLERFTDFYFDVCTLDYARMNEAMKPLSALMQKTDKVRITGPGTDLTFSIKGLPAIPCSGENNIPDGEIFTAPVRDSVNGVISYNTPSLRRGFRFENIRFEFENGKIVRATANDTDRLNEILDMDEGSRYIGEFAFGVNPYITKPMMSTLFDEKISGSFHFTPGSAYDECDNGNESANHWDLVCIQTEEYGGGEIYFDDVLIRKNGVFVLPELECLNPENLK